MKPNLDFKFTILMIIFQEKRTFSSLSLPLPLSKQRRRARHKWKERGRERG